MWIVSRNICIFVCFFHREGNTVKQMTEMNMCVTSATVVVMRNAARTTMNSGVSKL